MSQQTKWNSAQTELGLHFCSGVACVTISTPGSPVCRAKQSKTKKKKKESSSEYCLVLHFPFCFLIRVSRACRCRENLKRSCELRISTDTRCLSPLISCTLTLWASKPGVSSSTALVRQHRRGLGCRCAQESWLQPGDTWFPCSSPRRRKMQVYPTFGDGS